ncbi:MAG: type II toxin-antitoxin system Phd/YefM family antitoxin [Verrucomicrobia bacterium]|nr:type II toxin-antitoxin system Phd/YefM family antitoxin [Verrucomicrobiota bacterium]
MSEKTITVTDAARHFSKIVRRAEHNGSTVITRNGKAVARVVPARRGARNGPSAPKTKDLSPPVFGAIISRFPFVGCLKGEDSTDVRRVDDFLYGEGD